MPVITNPDRPDFIYELNIIKITHGLNIPAFPHICLLTSSTFLKNVF